MISSHAVATKNRAFPRWSSTRRCWKSMRFCSRSIGKARERWTRKPCKCPLGRSWLLTPGLRGPVQSNQEHIAQDGWGGNHMVSPPTTTKKPQKPKFGDAGGYSLKSSFYQSCLISFNKSVLCKWLMIVRILPRAKCTAISLRYSVFKKIKQNKTKWL